MNGCPNCFAGVSNMKGFLIPAQSPFELAVEKVGPVSSGNKVPDLIGKNDFKLVHQKRKL